MHANIELAAMYVLFIGSKSSTSEGYVSRLNESSVLRTPFPILRTFDPEEADYFYVPQYSTCFIYPIHGWADYPWFAPPGLGVFFV